METTISTRQEGEGEEGEPTVYCLASTSGAKKPKTQEKKGRGDRNLGSPLPQRPVPHLHDMGLNGAPIFIRSLPLTVSIRIRWNGWSVWCHLTFYSLFDPFSFKIG